MGKCTTDEQSISGNIRPQYSEVEDPSTSMSKVAGVSAGDLGNPSGSRVPANKDYYPE